MILAQVIVDMAEVQPTSCIVSQPPVHCGESHHGNSEDDQQRDDSAVVPRIFCATPLQGQEEANDGRHETDYTDRVELQDTLSQSGGRLCVPSWRFKEDEIGHSNDNTHCRVINQYHSPVNLFVVSERSGAFVSLEPPWTGYETHKVGLYRSIAAK